MELVGAEIRDTVRRPSQQQETGLFTSVSRPNCVQRMYQKADITPRAVYAALGPPGHKAAKNFCLAPVFLEPGPITVDLIKQEVSN